MNRLESFVYLVFVYLGSGPWYYLLVDDWTVQAHLGATVVKSFYSDDDAMMTQD